MKRIIFGVLVVSLGLLLKSCDTTDPPDNKSLTLKLEDISCTEAWIELTTTNLQLPATITLKQTNPTGDTKSHILNLISKDSLLYIDSLLPNKGYQYLASNIEHHVSSNELSVITMDTTSHNFTFQTWTFGENSGSTFYDVAIIDENNIWVVGEIYLNDSLGQPDTQPYAVAHWDGSIWSLMKVPYHDFIQTAKYPGPLFSVSYIDDNIYVVSYANLLKWTGNDWEEKAFFMEQIPFDGQVTKIWGIDENNIYCIGRNGAIYFYFGSNWQQIPSGTTLNINDIWGIVDGYGNKFILCPAYDFGSGGEKKLLSISSSTVGEIPWVESRELYTVWFNTRNKIYAAGEGLFYRTNNQWKEETLPELFKFRVRGNGFNDIWTAGGYGFAAHYNGINWKTFEEVSLASGNYLGLAVKGNTVVITGNEGIQAVITIGIRQ